MSVMRLKSCTLNQTWLFFEGKITLEWVNFSTNCYKSSHGGAIHTPTLRLVLDRGCVGSVNFQASVLSVSALVWGSGVSRGTPADDGKIPKERGRSLLEGQEKTMFDHVFSKAQFTNFVKARVEVFAMAGFWLGNLKLCLLYVCALHKYPDKITFLVEVDTIANRAEKQQNASW